MNEKAIVNEYSDLHNRNIKKSRRNRRAQARAIYYIASEANKNTIVLDRKAGTMKLGNSGDDFLKNSNVSANFPDNSKYDLLDDAIKGFREFKKTHSLKTFRKKSDHEKLQSVSANFPDNSEYDLLDDAIKGFREFKKTHSLKTFRKKTDREKL
jgi:hypothetical protein